MGTLRPPLPPESRTRQRRSGPRIVRLSHGGRMRRSGRSSLTNTSARSAKSLPRGRPRAPHAWNRVPRPGSRSLGEPFWASAGTAQTAAAQPQRKMSDNLYGQAHIEMIPRLRTHGHLPTMQTSSTSCAQANDTVSPDQVRQGLPVLPHRRASVETESQSNLKSKPD